MIGLSRQLAHAYRQEQALYGAILDLVRRQDRVMQGEGEPGAVIELCGEVERLMVDVAEIEQAMEPAKREWEKSKEDPGGELRSVLAAVEEQIGEIAQVQTRVQEQLLVCLQRQNESTEQARATVNAGRARRLYRAG